MRKSSGTVYDFNGLNIDFIFWGHWESFYECHRDFKINAIGQPTRGDIAYHYLTMEIDWAKIEVHKVVVPQDYHRYLSLLYGADFMEPMKRHEKRTKTRCA